MKKTALLFFINILALGVFCTPSLKAHAIGEELLGEAAATAAGSAPSGLPVFDLSKSIRDNIQTFKEAAIIAGDGLVWQAVNLTISHMTKSVVNWINTGFEGSPAFITDPEGFFADSLDQITGLYINKLGAEDILCQPFSLKIRLALVTNYAQTQVPRYACTLDRVTENLDGFFNDFQQGGWRTWIELTKEQNDPYLQYLNAYDDIERQRAQKLLSLRTELDWGNGFLSFRDEQGLITTPGAVIQDQLNNALDSTNRRLQVADEFNEIAGALLNQLIDKTLTSAGGLLGLSGNRGNTANNNYLSNVQASLAAEEAEFRARNISIIDEDLAIEQRFIDTKKTILDRITSTEKRALDVLGCLATATSTPRLPTFTNNFNIGIPISNTPEALEATVLETRGKVEKLLGDIKTATTTIAIDIAKAEENLAALTQYKNAASGIEVDGFLADQNDYYLFRNSLFGTGGIISAENDNFLTGNQLDQLNQKLDGTLNACRIGTLVQFVAQTQ